MVYAPKFPPITPEKAFPNFECNIYSDIDFQSAIFVSSTGNSRSFTELTDRLRFLNFSSPDYIDVVIKLHCPRRMTHVFVCEFSSHAKIISDVSV